jgi:hypothetical protein
MISRVVVLVIGALILGAIIDVSDSWVEMVFLATCTAFAFWAAKDSHGHHC